MVLNLLIEKLDQVLFFFLLVCNVLNKCYEELLMAIPFFELLQKSVRKIEKGFLPLEMLYDNLRKYGQKHNFLTHLFPICSRMFQGVEKGWIGNEWFKLLIKQTRIYLVSIKGVTGIPFKPLRWRPQQQQLPTLSR